MPIVGGRIDNVEATRLKDGRIDGININIDIEEIEVKGKDIEVKYLYTVKYGGGEIGDMKIRGTLFAKEDAKLAKEVDKEWNTEVKNDKGEKVKGKKIPPEYAATLIKVINYTCSANGTIVARVLNLSPPLIPPKVEVKR